MLKKDKKSKEYPGVRFDKKLKKYVATHVKNGMTFVSTNDTFEEAKTAKIKLES